MSQKPNVVPASPQKLAEVQVIALSLCSARLTQQMIDRGVIAANEYRASHPRGRSDGGGNTHDLVLSVLRAALEPDEWSQPEPAA